MTLGRLTQLGILGLLLCIFAWEIAGGIASQPCVIEAVDFRDLRAACEDGHVYDGPLVVNGSLALSLQLRRGYVVRHSALWGGFRHDGVAAGYIFTWYAAFFLVPTAYLAERILRPPVQTRSRR